MIWENWEYRILAIEILMVVITIEDPIAEIIFRYNFGLAYTLNRIRIYFLIVQENR